MLRPSRATTILFVGAVSLAFYYRYRQPTSSTMASDDLLSHLATSVTQSPASTTSKLSLTISVRNTHPSQTLSFIKWNSPLDSLALQLGILKLYPAGSDEPLDLPTIAIRRVMPPPRDTLVSLRPGEEEKQELEFGEPRVDLDAVFGKGESKGKARVGLKGEWSAVWKGAAKDMSDESLESMRGDPEAMTGFFEVRPVEIVRSGDR